MASSFGSDALAHADALYNLARYLTHNVADAEDLVQETYARALTARATFDGNNLKAWLLRILRNAFIDGWRKQRPMVPVADASPAAPADVAQAQLGPLAAADVEAALRALSEEARTVILLDLEGLTEGESAAVMGCAVGTVKSRLARARAMLRERLEEWKR